MAWRGWKEQFAIKPETLYKLLNYLWVVGIISIVICGVLFIKNIFFSKPSSNNNKQNFHVSDGGTVNSYVTNVVEREKPLVRVIPYIDANTGYNSNRDKYFDSAYGWEIKGGVRLEMDGLFEKLFTKSNSKQTVETK